MIRKPSRQTADLAATAHHEAGHAVADWILGHTIVEVSIVPGGHPVGHVRHRPSQHIRERDRLIPDTAHQREQVQHQIVALLAGAEAEARFRRMKVTTVVRSGGPEQDWKDAELLAEDLEPVPPVRTGLFTYLNAKTRDLVECQWPLVEALADALIERHQLDALSIQQVLQEAIKRGSERLGYEESWNLTAGEWRNMARELGYERVWLEGIRS